MALAGSPGAARVGLATLPLRGRPSQGVASLASVLSCELDQRSLWGAVSSRPEIQASAGPMMGAYPGVVVDARRGTRELSQACSVEAARTASAVRGDQDHEDRDHCQRQTYSQPRLPVPLSPTIDPARVVHLEPPLRASSSFTRMYPRDHSCRHG